MAGFFSPDSKLYKFMTRLTDVFVLNVMWLVFSLPIVTIGASTIAACSVTLHMAEDTEGHAAKDFLKAFKANIKQGIPMTFITLICVWAVYLDFQIYGAEADMGHSGALIFLIIGIVAAYIFAFSLLNVYPLLARYENSIINSLKNSFRISMKFFLRSLLLLILVAFEAAVIMWNTTTLFVGLLIGPVFILFTISSFAIRIFRELEKTPGTISNPDNKY